MKQTKLLLLMMTFLLPLAHLHAAETESNNTRATANTLAFGGSNTGAINVSGDEDWWAVTIPADGKLNVTITISNGLTMRCQIYDFDGIALLESDYTSSTKVISEDGLSAGTYYLKVYAFTTGQLPAYTISNTLTEPAEANDSETNNSRADAKTLNLNSAKTGHVNYYYNLQRDSSDWYKVTTNADGRLRLTLTSGNGQTVRAYLYDNNGTTLLEDGYTSLTAAVVNKDGLAVGTYYIKIIAFTASTGFIPYTLADSLFTPAQANDAEPNDSRADAKTLNLNSSKTGHINYYYNLQRDSSDWYKVTTNADGRLRLTLTSGNGQTVRAYLYDNNGTTLLEDGYTSSTAAVVNKDGLAVGTYYVKIIAFTASSGYIPYTLADSLFTPAQANDAEPNDTKATAVTLPLNGSSTGHTNYYYNLLRDGEDWYQLTTNADGMLSITIQSHNGQTVYAYLYDNDGVTELDNVYTSSSASYTVDGLQPGTYYLKVRAFTTSTGFVPYTLSNTLTTYANSNDTEPNGSYAQATTIPANDSVTGHVNFYYNLVKDAEDRWKINYTGTGNMTLIFSQENRLKYSSPDVTYFRVYKDTNAAPIGGTYYTTNSATLNLTALTQGYYYIKVNSFTASGLSHFSSYGIKATFTQDNIAKIKVSSYDTVSVCSSTNKISYKGSGSNAPYKVQLYRYGVAYGSPVSTTKNANFNNLPVGSYYATAYGDGATGTAFGKSKTVSVMPIPAGTNTTGITSTKATANWALVSCAKYYSVYYRIKGETDWTKKKTTGNLNSYEMKNLIPAAVYEWEVAAVDSANSIIATGLFTDSLTFTTAASFAVNNQSSNESITAAKSNHILVMPNPAVSQFVLQANIQAEGNVSLALVDMNGKQQWSNTINAAQLKSYSVNVSNLSSGMYLLQVKDRNNKIIATEKVIIKR